MGNIHRPDYRCGNCGHDVTFHPRDGECCGSDGCTCNEYRPHTKADDDPIEAQVRTEYQEMTLQLYHVSKLRHALADTLELLEAALDSNMSKMVRTYLRQSQQITRAIKRVLKGE